MRLGCCGTINDAEALKAAGFDFLEVNVQNILCGDEPSSTWDKTAPDPAKIPLPIEAANCLVPANRPIIGPTRDLVGLQDYMQRVAKRAQRLGIKRFVFGSGGARRRPEGIDPATAQQHLYEFTKMAGEICAHHDVVLVIEHLNKKETNTLNSLSETLALCHEVDDPNVAMLVDSFHYGVEREGLESILEIGSELRHVHVAEPSGRCQPGTIAPGTSGELFDFEEFFCALRKIGYDERISIECTWVGKMEDQAPSAARFLRNAWENVGHCAI